jgi:hypothetical protein
MSTINFNVTRGGSTVGVATLNWAAVGTGSNPLRATDFVGGALLTGTVSFGDGQATATIAVSVASNAVHGRTFAVRLSNPSVGEIRQGAAAGVIAAPVFSISAAP